MKKLIIILMVLFVGCSTVQYKNESYDQTRSEIEDIIKHDTNLTDAQKIVLKHAAADLKTAQAQSKENAKLTTEIIKTSKSAGAGNLVYVMLGIIGAGIVAFIVSKIVKFIPF